MDSNKGLDYTFRLVRGDNPEWLAQEINKALDLAVTKETETPTSWCQAAQQSLKESTYVQQFWLWVALLTMKSLQDRAGTTSKQLEQAQQLFDAFLKGVAYKGYTMPTTTPAGLTIQLRNAYLNR